MKLGDLGTARVAVWGAGQEGLAAARAVRARWPGKGLVVLEETTARPAPEALLADGGVHWKTGPVTVPVLKEFDVVIRSPGISIYREEIVEAKTAGVVFTSGTNLWFAENSDGRTVCVTGSKGKSTTTHLIAHLLQAFGLRAQLAGNMGRPLLESPVAEHEVTYVVELSSYQLSDFTGLPTVAVLLNLYPEHLDWHRGEQPYYRDKLRLFAEVTQARVINWRDERSRQYTGSLGQVVYFNSPDGFQHDDIGVYCGTDPWISLDELQLLGAHNLSNICAALTAVAAYGVEMRKEPACDALREFRGLDHRLSRLGEREGVLYVDDSIATIPQATAAALRAFAGRPVTVLAGGYDRGLAQREFAQLLLDESPFAVITLPGTGAVLFKEIRALACEINPPTAPVLREARDLEEAVALARELTPAGGVVLLSPGAPSFNTHRDFAARGAAFARAAGFYRSEPAES